MTTRPLLGRVPSVYPGARTRNLNWDSVLRSDSLTTIEMIRQPQRVGVSNGFVDPIAYTAADKINNLLSAPSPLVSPACLHILQGGAVVGTQLQATYYFKGFNQFNEEVEELAAWDRFDSFRARTVHAYSVVTEIRLLKAVYDGGFGAETFEIGISGRNADPTSLGNLLGQASTYMGLPFRPRSPKAIRAMFNLQAIEPTWDTDGALDPNRRWYYRDDDFQQAYWAGISVTDGVEWRQIGFVGDGTSGSDRSWADEDGQDYDETAIVQVESATVLVPVYTSSDPLRFAIVVDTDEIIANQ